MAKTYQIFFMVFLLLVSAASAVWDPLETPKEYYQVGNSVHAGSVNVKILDIDVEGRKAIVNIKNTQGKLLFEGPITKSEGYVRGGSLRVIAKEFKYYDPARPEVKISIEDWTSAKISDVNFPDEVYKLDAYKVYAMVTNTGPHTATFTVELSGKGNLHVDNAALERNPSYDNTIKAVLNSASQEVTLKPRETKKVYFEIQQEGKVGENMEPTFKIMTNEGYLIEQLDLESVPIVNKMTGYLENMIAPGTTAMAGDETMVEIYFRNSWLAASNNYVIKFIAPEFRVYSDTKHPVAFPQSTEKVVFRILPYGGGTFTVTAELSIGKTVVDTLSADVTIFGEKIYKITELEAPDKMYKDDEGTVSIVVVNSGPTVNTMAVVVTSDDFAVKNPEAVVRMNPGSENNVVFDIKALKNTGSGLLKVQLYDPPEKFYTSQYNKLDKVADSKTISVKLGDDAPKQVVELKEEAQEIVEELEEQVPEEKEEEPEVVEEPQEEPEKTALTANDYIPYIVVGILILLAIFLIASRKGKKPDVEVYDLKPKKKKKK